MIPCRIRMVLKMLLIACVIGGVLCGGKPPEDGELEDSVGSLRGAAYDAYTNTKDAKKKVLVSTIQHTGRAAPKVIGAIQSSGEFVLNEVGDHAVRIDGAIRNTLPKHSTRLKDSGYETAGVAANHVTNQLDRLSKGTGSLIEATDDVFGTVHNEGRNFVRSKAKVLNSGIRFVGKVSSKLDDVVAGTLDTAGDVITDPQTYLVTRPMAQLKSLRARLNSFREGGGLFGG